MNEEFKLKMTVTDALKFADEWSRGLTIHEGSQGWRIVCMLLAEEVRRLTAELDGLRAQEPVAYRYELATILVDGVYQGWDTHITNFKPEVPDGAVRNLTTLYAHSVPAAQVVWNSEDVMRNFGPVLKPNVIASALNYSREDGAHYAKTQAAQSVPDDVLKDAARYQWLRNNRMEAQAMFWNYESRKQRDAAIDAAIAAAAPKEPKP